jgi:hypothetical protein
MQLVAYGAQDIYLTGNPQITFFKVVYRRHTNFSMESIEQTFNGTADFGKKVTCTISRNGDLIHRVYLQATLPQMRVTAGSFRWLNYLGHILVKNVEVEIGGQRIDKHYGDWLHIWNELTQTSGHQAGYANMVGNVPRLTQPVSAVAAAGVDGAVGSKTPGSQTGGSAGPSTLSREECDIRACMPQTTLYVPLQFWFCRNPGLALPLIALQYHEVKINLEFNNLDNCRWVSNTGATSPQTPSLVSASLYVDYIYLDTDERRRFAQVSHEYLIEQLQFTGDESVNSTSNKIKLNFNHPCKELIWVCQPDSNVDASTCTNVGGKQHFNYTDKIDATYFSGNPSDPLGGGMYSQSQNPFQGLPLVGRARQAVTAVGNVEGGEGAVPEVGFAGGTSNGIINSAAITFEQLLNADGTGDSTPTGNGWMAALPFYDLGHNPVDKAKLQLNGHDRFSEREGRYFNLVQPYQHHENVPATGINVYSFGLKPEEHQPSGTCNMSRIDNAVLQLTLTDDAVKAGGNAATCKVRVYATNYNVLRIMSGMGGLAYSN